MYAVAWAETPGRPWVRQGIENAGQLRSKEVTGLKEQQSEVTNIRIVLRAGYFDGEVTGVWYNLVGLGWCSVYNSHVADVFSFYSAYCTNNAGI